MSAGRFNLSMTPEASAADLPDREVRGADRLRVILNAVIARVAEGRSTGRVTRFKIVAATPARGNAS